MTAAQAPTPQQPATDVDAPLLTRREYLLAEAVASGAHFLLALEAVASTAIEHPEWDMTEQRTWREWANTGTRRRAGRHRAS